jgi:hypothetical protein
LRQAGFRPVVASMGTALTASQLRELNRLTKRLFLCFDSDAAGAEATLLGMELAVGQGFDVQVVSLAKGTDPADDPKAFEARLAKPVSYPVHRVRLLHERAQAGLMGVDPRLSRRLPIRRSARMRCGSPPTSSICRPSFKPALRLHVAAVARQASSRRACSTLASGSSAPRSRV